MIELKNLSFTYQGSSKHGGLSDINLTIADKECVLLCGRSGCGKTSLIRLINGLIPSFYPGDLNGEVSIDRQSVQGVPMYKLANKVGSVFQNPRSQFFNIDTDSEIVFGMENLSWDLHCMQERLEKTIDDLKIENLIGRKVSELSGGEKQKIAFASIYALSPNIYLLDEPSSNLDMPAITGLRQVLSFLKEQGKTILIAEHRIHYLREIVDRIIYIDKGKIEKELMPNELCELQEHERQSLGLRTINLNTISLPSLPRQARHLPILEIHSLTLSHHKKIVIRDINMTAAPGEIIGIIGHNGAGKSTFSRALCGLHKESCGTIKWDGKIVNHKQRLKLSYMVMQEVGYQLFADTLEKECVFGISSPDYKSAELAMKQLNIWQYKDSHPSTLSGGQKQRAAVAVSMVCKRDILIFDEPTSGLDYDSMIQVSKLCERLSAMGKIVFVVTHDYEFLVSACSRVLHLGDGKVIDDYPICAQSKDKLQNFFDLKNS